MAVEIPGDSSEDEPDPARHLAEEVGWLRLLLRRHVEPRGDGASPPVGLGMEELQAFLEGGWGTHPLDDEIERARRAIDEGPAADAALPWQRLLERLEPAEPVRRLLNVLLAATADPWAARAVRVAHDDPAGRAPDVGFYVRLLRPGSDELGAIRDALAADGPVRGLELIRLGPGAEEERGEGETEGAIWSRPVELAPTVVSHALGRAQPPEVLHDHMEARAPSVDWNDLWVSPEHRQEFRALGGELEELRLVLYGPEGVGKRSVAEALAAQQGRSLVVVEDEVFDRDPRHVDLVRREVWLREALLYVDSNAREQSPPWAEELVRGLRELSLPVVIGATTRQDWHDRLPSWTVFRHLRRPAASERVELWRAALRDVAAAPDLDVDRLARTWTLTPAGIAQAVASAQASAQRRNPVRPVVGWDDLEAACRRRVVSRLSTLGSRIPLGFAWSDLILPQTPREQLEEFIAYARQTSMLFDRWGFDRKMPYGRGVAALFNGPPGTGKTMAASIVASELGLELYRIDVSQVTSKYVGETEKNLAQVFAEAQDSGVVLLFDEADALFTKRTDVQSSVDRYANLEVNFLLQKMEDFDGVTLLTTNFDKNLDQAFRRRIKFHVHFPFPDEPTRERLWSSMVPEEMPLSDDVEWNLLGEYELAGGHIRNAILRAAVRAAEENRSVTHEDLEQAAVRESVALGRVVRSPFEGE